LHCAAPENETGRKKQQRMPKKSQFTESAQNVARMGELMNATQVCGELERIAGIRYEKTKLKCVSEKIELRCRDE